MTYEQLPQDLKAAIDAVVSSCDGIAYPKVCQKMGSETGQLYLKNRMIYMVLYDNLPTFSACLPHLEQELSGM